MGEDVFWQTFKETLSVSDYDKIIKIKNEHLKMGHDPYNIEERMNFINQLPIEYDIQFYGEIKAQLEKKMQQEDSKKKRAIKTA